SAIMLPDGTAMRCSFCDRPAVQQARGWHRMKLRIPLLPLLIGRADIPLGFSIPIFPKLFTYCEFHAKPPSEQKAEENAGEGSVGNFLRGFFRRRFGDLAERNPQLHAQPALHGGRVRELPAADELLHAGVAGCAFFPLTVAVLGPRNRAVIANPVVADTR